MKRVFDIICSACGLLFLSPGLVLIACMIRAGDRGPVFYHGVRVGLNGRLFRIFKFRTMVVDAEKLGASSTSDDDARITRISEIKRAWPDWKRSAGGTVVIFTETSLSDNASHTAV